MISVSRGVASRPVDTLLVERARDFLAGGPATAAVLVAGVCQMPVLAANIADRVAHELLGAFDDFERLGDGRWTLAPRVDRPREAGFSPAPAPPPVPTFDEWRSAREAARPIERSVEPAHTVRATRRAAFHTPPMVGDDDRLTDLSYAVVDVETTGGTLMRGHRITEFAAVVVRGGEVREVYETLVNPQRSIPPQIMRLTGITYEMVRDKPAFAGICDAVTSSLAGHVFVAHNVAFDWRFVSGEVERVSGQRLEGRRLCTVRLARKLLPHLRSRSLGHVANYYGADTFAQSYFESRHGPDRPWRHSAAGDAVATAHCLLRLLNAAADRGVTTWGELDRWLLGGTAAGRRRRRAAMPGPVDKDTTA